MVVVAVHLYIKTCTERWRLYRSETVNILLTCGFPCIKGEDINMQPVAHIRKFTVYKTYKQKSWSLISYAYSSLVDIMTLTTLAEVSYVLYSVHVSGKSNAKL